MSSAASTAHPAHGALPALDTLQGLLRRGLTGCLSARDAHGGVRQVYLSQGEVFAALAPEDGPWLLRRLLNQGLIGERQAASISWSLGRGGAYEELLSGHVPDALLFAAMEDRFRQNLAEFIGQPGRLEWTATEGIFVANVQGGHDTARLLRGLLDAIEQTAPLLARREALTLRPGAHPPQRPEQQRLAELCAPAAPLAEVLAFSPHEELDTASLLVEMLSHGILSTVEPLRLPVHRPPAVEDAYEVEELFSLDDAGAGRPAPTLPVSYINALSEPVEVPDGQDFGDGLGEELARWIARGASAEAPVAPRADEAPAAPSSPSAPIAAPAPAPAAVEPIEGPSAGLVWAEDDAADAHDPVPVGLSIMGAPAPAGWADDDDAAAPAPAFEPLDERRLPAADAVVEPPRAAAAAPLPFDSAALDAPEDDVQVEGLDELPADPGTEELPVEAASEDDLALDEPALGADELVDSLGGRISLVNFRRDPIPPGTEALSPPPAPAPDALVQTAARYLEEAEARRAARPRRAVTPPPDEDLDAWLHGGAEAAPTSLPEGASRWLPPRDAELDPGLLALFSDQDDIRGLGDGHFSVAERNLDRVDLRDELPVSAPRRPPVEASAAEAEEVLEAAEADAEAEANAINLNFGPPPLRDEEARSKLAVAQDVLVQLARRLDAHSGVGAGSAAVQVLLESTPGGGRRLFSHVNAGMDGRIDLNLVVGNLRRLPEPERRSALDAALMDLIDRALGVGCEALPNAEVDDLIGAIAGYQQRLGL